jgi:hypothetical protein
MKVIAPPGLPPGTYDATITDEGLVVHPQNRVQRWSQLPDDERNLIRELAAEKKCQIWAVFDELYPPEGSS